MSKEKKSKINVGAILGIIFLIIIIVVGIAFAYVNGMFGTSPDANDIMGTISAKLSDEAKLITQSAEISFPYDTGKDYRTLPNTNIKIPFTAKNIQIHYRYTVNAGIKDLTQAEYESNGSTLIIKLPKVEILNDETDIGTYDESKNSNNPFNQVNADEINNLLVMLKDKATQRSIDEGILVRAENYTEDLLNEKFKNILEDKYDIDVQWK